MTAARSSIAYYSAGARRLAARYDSVAFDEVHQDLLAELPAKGASVLDIGAGSGRDALALAARGFQVTAAEPSTALRRHAEAADMGRQVTWIDDRLPKLSRLKGAGQQFDFVLCSAVLMHVPASELDDAFASMSHIMRPGARLAVSVRDPTSADPAGLYHRHPDSAVVGAALKAGLPLSRRSQRNDTLGRAALTWRTYLFDRPA